MSTSKTPSRVYDDEDGETIAFVDKTPRFGASDLRKKPEPVKDIETGEDLYYEEGESVFV